METTKLCLKDIYELADVCTSQSYFLWSNETRTLETSGPIALYFIVVLSKG